MKPADPLLATVRAVARDAEPEPLDDIELSAMVQKAMAAADADVEAPQSTARRGRWFALVAAVACLGLAVAVGLSTRDSSAAPLSLTLPSGDHLVATAGASFELESADVAERTIALDRGTMLFDVTPLATGEAFVVRTPHASVRVRGTVFSVEVDADDTTVRVYEGRVEVARGGRSTPLVAGAMLRSGHERPSALTPGALGEQGVRAAAARSAAWGEGESRPTVAVVAVARDEAPRPPEAASATATATATATETAPAPQAEAPDDPVVGRAAAPRARAEAPADPSLADARRWLVDGEARRALLASRSRRQPSSEWRWVEADALRALGRQEEAADAYDALHASAAPGSTRAGLSAARLRFHRLGDAEGALRSLAGTTHAGSAFAERGLALRARSLVRLERHGEARRVAREYLERYPDGGMAEWMRDLLATR